MAPLYPQDSEKAGPAFWITMHNVAAKYPQRPDSHDKLMFKHWLDYTISHYVCPNPCVKNARKYLKANPLDLSSRKALSYDMCKFHNHVREDQGKNQIACDSVLGEAKSPELLDGDNNNDAHRDTDSNHSDLAIVNDDAGNEQSPASTHGGSSEQIDVDSSPKVQVLADVSSALKKLKNASTSVFKALCREFKLPYPDFYYKPCPSMPETSCTSFPIDGEGKVAGKSTVYLNQHVYSPETIAHEFWHYYHKMKGEDNLAGDEDAITAKAKRFIQDRFPHDDTVALGEVVSKKVYYEVKKVTRYEKNYTELMSSEGWKNRYPHFASRFKEEVAPDSTAAFTASSIATPSQEEGNEGFLRHFDGIYGHLEKGFGVPKEWLNYSYSPEIISTITQTIVESNFSPVGSLVISTLLGLGLGGYVVFNKNSITPGDKLLLTEMSAHFTTNTIRYANKDAMSHVMTDVERLGAALVRLDFMEMANIIVGRSMFGGYDDVPGSQHTPLLPPAPQRPVGAQVPTLEDDVLLAYGYQGRGHGGRGTKRGYATTAASIQSAVRSSIPSAASIQSQVRSSLPSATQLQSQIRSSIPTINVTRSATPTIVPVSPVDIGFGGSIGGGTVSGPPPAAMGGPEAPSGGFGGPDAGPAAGPGMGAGGMGMGMGPDVGMGPGMGVGPGGMGPPGLEGEGPPGLGGGVMGGPMGVGMEMGSDMDMQRERERRRRKMMMEDQMRQEGMGMGRGHGMGQEREGRGMGMERERRGFGPEAGFDPERVRQRRFFQRRGIRGAPNEPIYSNVQPEQQEDLSMEIRRRRLISGIDEEGFYHGAEGEIESNEGIASDYWGNTGRNSLNLGEDGFY